MLTPLSKRRFGVLKALHAKKERRETGRTLIEGERLVAEAVQLGVPVELVVGSEEFWARRNDLIHSLAAAGIPASVANSAQMRQLTLTETAPGIVAMTKRPDWDGSRIWGADSREFLALLAVGVQDPGNVGTLIRTTAAAAGRGVWLGPGCAEVASPKTVRASAGAVFRLPCVENADPLSILARCRERNIQTLAAVPKRGRPYAAFDYNQPTLFVLGGEGAGLPEEIAQACDYSLQIPMPGGTESLNVAAAGAVLLYEAVRQRRLQSTKRRESR